MYSIVTPNRNRIEPLKAVIPSWQSQDLISEIVVVDYGSENPIRLDDFASAEKIKIVRVEGTDDWRIGHATNIGVDWATRRYICKLDSDVLIERSDWLRNLVLDASFFRGHFQTTIPNGEVLFSKDHWKALGGYNEWLTGYGFDDTDFYIRLRSFGVKERHIPSSFLRTLKHAQAQRGGYKTTYRFMHIEDPSTKAAVDQYKNTLLSFMHEWNASLRTPYTVLANADHGVTVRTERLRDNYKFQDAIAETISALCIMTRDDATKRHIEGLIAWLVKEAGGFGEKPEW